MTGDDQEGGVTRARPPYGPGCLGPPHVPRDFTVRNRLAPGEVSQEFQDLPLERAYLEIERDIPKVPLPRSEVLQDSFQVRVFGPSLRERLPGKSDPPHPAAQDLKLHLQAQLPAELRVEGEGFPCACGIPLQLCGSNPCEGKHGADDVLLRLVEVFLERTPGRPQGLADVVHGYPPREVVVSGIEGGHESVRLLLRKAREKEGGTKGISGRGPVRESPLGEEPGIGEEGFHVPEVDVRTHQEGHVGLSTCPSDRWHDVGRVVGKEANYLPFRLASLQDAGHSTLS